MQHNSFYFLERRYASQINWGNQGVEAFAAISNGDCSRLKGDPDVELWPQTGDSSFLLVSFP